MVMEQFLAAKAAVESLNQGIEMLKTFEEVKDANNSATLRFDLNRKILEAQQYALEAQREQLNQQTRISELEQEIAHLKSWENFKEDYSLEEVSKGTYLYVSKENFSPEIWLCPNCFERAAKSILQANGAGVQTYYHSFKCPNCQETYNVSRHTRPGNWKQTKPT
ncbi:hypothetical protein [Hirschia litorea]|uniref:Uncharacterized protein n=1 Tax=Hirschia litorea TaxID=1199156 RepID=A0ABW2IIJ8_9PROT